MAATQRGWRGSAACASDKQGARRTLLRHTVEMGDVSDVRLPTRSLLICGNQRSGTTMLCRALEDTSVCGRPEEYFLAEDPTQLPEWRFWEDGLFGVRHGAKGRGHYLRIVYGLGTTPNGVFAAKLMWNNLS